MRLSYNSPIILTYSLVCLIVLLTCQLFGESYTQLFVLDGSFHWARPADYFGLVSYIFGHADWNHFIGNISLILLIGPTLEEKYGSPRLLELILITAFLSAIINILFFGHNIIGASGIVFMMILLSSFTGFKDGEIPLTFVLIFIIYIGRELMAIFDDDQISQYAHIIGGICGAFFGFYLNKHRDKRATQSDFDIP